MLTASQQVIELWSTFPALDGAAQDSLTSHILAQLSRASREVTMDVPLKMWAAVFLWYSFSRRIALSHYVVNSISTRMSKGILRYLAKYDSGDLLPEAISI